MCLTKRSPFGWKRKYAGAQGAHAKFFGHVLMIYINYDDFKRLSLMKVYYYDVNLAIDISFGTFCGKKLLDRCRVVKKTTFRQPHAVDEGFLIPMEDFRHYT